MLKPAVTRLKLGVMAWHGWWQSAVWLAVMGFAQGAWGASFDVTPAQLRSVPPNFPLKVTVQLTHTGATPALYTLYASEHGEQIPIRTSRLRKFVMSRNGQSLQQTVQFLGTQQRQRTVKVCARVQEKDNLSTLDLCSDVVVR